MCFDCDKETITRRSFLTSAAVALTATAVEAGTREQRKFKKALNDPDILHGAATFQNGPDTIQGYLARPRTAGRYRAVVILHGNAGLPEDIRNTAAQVAQAGFVGLAISCTSREPDPSKIPRDFLRSNSFGQRYMQDTQAGIAYLKTQPFVRPGGVGMVGFCGGGIVSLMFSTASKDVGAVVALYAAPFVAPENNLPSDPRPHLISFVAKFNVPIQCHYGTRDDYIPLAEVRQFQQEIEKQRAPVELFLYEGAAHGFANYTDSTYNSEAAHLAESRMLAFLRKHLR
jgi:carboxymethylenebutenolidase